MDDELTPVGTSNDSVPTPIEIHSRPVLETSRESSLTALTEQEAEQLSGYLQAATSDNTRRTYQSAIRQFMSWGGLLPTDRDSVIRYILDKAGTLNTRSIDLHITALRQWHETQGFTDPTRDSLVKKTLIGIRRTHGKPKVKARPLHLQDLQQLFTHFGVLGILPPNIAKTFAGHVI